MNADQQRGYDFAKGAMRYLLTLLVLGYAIMFALSFLLRVFGAWVDDSDESAWSRSGMRVHRDHKTGVEYLSVPGSSLIKREH